MHSPVTLRYYCSGTSGIKEPKAKGSVRRISMPEYIMEMFRKHQRWQEKERLRLEGYWQDHNFIFTQSNGKMMNYSTPYQTFKKILLRYNATQEKEDMKLPDIPLHGLRHTCATIMMANHADPVSVAARLGHSQTSTTLNTYSHAVQCSDQNASSILEKALLTPTEH